ncbi:MAG: hypothetical protein KBD16_00765 [Candidatus Pacebacteria bacterium]|nr:hypothetical protein [Candidatus Paceibacterota bacterium]
MTKATDYARIISQHMSRMGKKSHQKSPRDPEHFKRMQAASVASRLAKKIKK